MAEEETLQIESPPIIPNNLPFSVSSNTPSAQEPVVYDLVSDPRQGLGVPAKGLYVRNRGTSGTLNVTILSGDGGERSFALQYSEEIGFDQDDGIHVWSVILSGSIDSIPYDLPKALWQMASTTSCPILLCQGPGTWVHGAWINFLSYIIEVSAGL